MKDKAHRGPARIMLRRSALSVLTVVMLLVAIIPVSAGDAPADISNSSTSTYIVVFNDTPQAKMMSAQSASALVSSYGGEVKERFGILNGMAVTIPDSMTDQLKSLPNVKYVEKDEPVNVLLDQAVPQIGANQAWAEGYTGMGVKVAVLDSGIDVVHPDLNGAKVIAWKDFTSANYKSPHDGLGHGTHVSGIIAGNGNASSGRYRGVAPDASLIEGKVLDDSGTGSTSDIILGMDWAVSQGAQVISLSLGGNHTQALDDEVAKVTAEGVVVVVAAGNGGPGNNTITCPGDAPAAITVGAVYKNDTIASFSSRGPGRNGTFKPDVTNVGASVVSARSSQGTDGSDPAKNPYYPYYMSMSGTSMATPMTSGVVALMLQKNASLTPAQVKSILQKTAKPMGGTVPNYNYGYGRVQANYALDNVTYSVSGYNASYLADTINGTFIPGNYMVTITMLNNGNQPWSRSTNVTLHCLNDSPQLSVPIIQLPNNTVILPGDRKQYTWSFNISVTTLKHYNLTYQMYVDNTPMGDPVIHPIRVKNELQPGIIQFNNTSSNAQKISGKAIIEVDRIAGWDNTVTVNYNIVGGNAIPDFDYAQTNSTITFAQDQDCALIAISLLNNGTYVGEKTVNLTLGNTTGGAMLGNNSTVLTINDTYVNYTYRLYKGWNMISVPFTMNNTSVEEFFPPEVKAKVSDMWWYNHSKWVYYSGIDGYNAKYANLTDVEPGKGYYVLVTDDVVFTVNGTWNVSNVPPASSGWTLFGVNGMNSIMSTAVYSKNLDLWYLSNGTWYYYSGKDGFLSKYPHLISLDPGKGYWVNYG